MSATPDSGRWAEIVRDVERRQAERRPGATFTPAPKLQLTRKWKTYTVLLVVWFVGAVMALIAFLAGADALEAVADFFWRCALLVLVGFIMRPPVQYKEATK